MKITKPQEVLELLVENPSELIFGFDNETQTWIRVQYMTVQEILESKDPFHLLRLHSKSVEDSDFLFNLLLMNFGRHVVDYR